MLQSHKMVKDTQKIHQLMLSEANKLVSDNQISYFCYADVNCIAEVKTLQVKNGRLKISLTHFRI